MEVADFALDSNYHQPGDFISNLNVGAFITNTKVALSPSLPSQKIKVPETTNSGGNPRLSLTQLLRTAALRRGFRRGV